MTRLLLLAILLACFALGFAACSSTGPSPFGGPTEQEDERETEEEDDEDETPSEPEDDTPTATAEEDTPTPTPDRPPDQKVMEELDDNRRDLDDFINSRDVEGEPISVLDLETGDCFIGGGTGTFTEVELVPCDGPFDFLVTSQFTVEGDGPFPGIDFFRDQVAARCDAGTDTFFFPTEGSWNQGDRLVTCLDANPNTSGDDDRVGDIVTTFNLRTGECFDRVNPGDFSALEIVSCSGPHEFRITLLFDVPDSPEYPGDAFIDDQAMRGCPADTDTFLTPDAATWPSGDREVICLAEGGDGSDSRLGDSLSPFDLLEGDCLDTDGSGSFDTVVLVACSGPFEFRVLNLFEVPDTPSYPGNAFFRDQANERCDNNAATFLFPLQDLWEQGERLVICLARG